MNCVFLLFLAVSYIDPFETESIEDPQLLTVEGMVTSGVGPHVIKLFRSANYGSIFEALIRPVSGARMIVRDDLGNVTFSTENTVDRGSYNSQANFSAQVGRSYTLLFRLVDGKAYSSFPETLQAVGERKKRIYINGQDINFRQLVAIVPEDCREIAGSTTSPPKDWNL